MNDQPNPQPSQRRFWLWFGVIFATVFSLAAGIVGFFVYQTYTIGKNITSPTPIAVPVETPDQEKLVDLGERLTTFQTAIAEDQPGELVLSAEDLNTLISTEPDFAGRFYFDIQEDEVSLKGALPLNSIPGFEGRFFNGTIAMRVNLQDQNLVVTPTKLVLDNPEMPSFVQEALLNSLKEQNLAEEAAKEPEFRQWLQTVKSIRVDAGKIIISR